MPERDRKILQDIAQLPLVGQDEEMAKWSWVLPPLAMCRTDAYHSALKGKPKFFS